MIKKLLQSLRGRAETFGDKHQYERVRYQTGNAPDTALAMLEHIVTETEYGQKLKESLPVTPAYMEALVAFAKESDQTVSDPEVAALLGREVPFTSQSFICSTCWETFTFADLTVLPWWNPDEGCFFTSYRCPTCAPDSLADTRARLSDVGRETAESFLEFLRSHKQYALADAYARAEPAQASALAHHFLEDVEQNPLTLIIRADDIVDFFQPRP
jgi:hypothetical protein